MTSSNALSRAELELLYGYITSWPEDRRPGQEYLITRLTAGAALVDPADVDLQITVKSLIDKLQGMASIEYAALAFDDINTEEEQQAEGEGS